MLVSGFPREREPMAETSEELGFEYKQLPACLSWAFHTGAPHRGAGCTSTGVICKECRRKGRPSQLLGVRGGGLQFWDISYKKLFEGEKCLKLYILKF